MQFSKEAFIDIFGFGMYVLGNDIVGYFTKNVDYLIIGRVLGADPLGIYTLAFLLTDTFRSSILPILKKCYILFTVKCKKILINLKDII